MYMYVCMYILNVVLNKYCNTDMTCYIYCMCLLLGAEEVLVYCMYVFLDDEEVLIYCMYVLLIYCMHVLLGAL